MPTIGRLSPETLRAWLSDGHDLALLEARGEGEFGAGHLFWAVPCPLSRAELRIPLLLPRLAARIVCVDDGRGVADRLSALLAERGADNVQILDGGTTAWQQAGYVLFTGVNVPSKAFGEWVEHHYGTESIDPAELKAWQDEGRDLAILDSRPLDEFHRMSIPGGINVPGGGTRLPRRRPGARPQHHHQLRRADPQHPRRRKLAAGRGAEPCGRAAQRHDGLAARRSRRGQRPR